MFGSHFGSIYRTPVPSFRPHANSPKIQRFGSRLPALNAVEKAQLTQAMATSRPALKSLDELPEDANICVFFGAFNPIHGGHVKTAEFLLSQQEHQPNAPNMVVFIPLPTPPHKQHRTDMAAMADRVDMVRLSIEKFPQMRVCHYDPPSADAPTEPEEILKSIAPRLFNADRPIYSLVGSDTLKLLSPRSINLIRKSCFLQIPVEGMPIIHDVVLDGRRIRLNTRPLGKIPCKTRSTDVRLAFNQRGETPNCIEPMAGLFIREKNIYPPSIVAHSHPV